MDLAIVLSLAVSFGTLVTCHVVLSVALARYKGKRWRAALAFLLPPLAPFWGFEAGHRLVAGIWISALVVYVAAYIAAGS